MRLTEPIETLGFFWFSEDPKARKPGILHISDSGEVKLKIIDVPDNSLSLMQARPNRIVGIVEEGGLVTLEGCTSDGGSLSLSDNRLSELTYRARFAFIGVDCGPGEELTFSKLGFSVEGLDKWLSVSGGRPKLNSDKSIFIEYRYPEEISLSLHDGIELNFRFGMSLSGLDFPHTKMSITQTPEVILTLREPKPIEYFKSLIFKLRNFFSFAIDETVEIDFITGYLERETENGKKYQMPIDVYGQIGSHSETKPEIYRHNILFTYPDIDGRCEEVLAKWLESHQIFETAFNIYFSSRYDASKYLDIKFLLLIRGMEALREGTEKSNRPSLKQQIRAIVEPFPQWFGDQNESSQFVNKVINTRGYLTHHDIKYELQAARGEDLWKLYERLEALFQLHLLKLIGVDIDSIVKKTERLRSKLQICQI